MSGLGRLVYQAWNSGISGGPPPSSSSGADIVHAHPDGYSDTEYNIREPPPVLPKRSSSRRTKPMTDFSHLHARGEILPMPPRGPIKNSQLQITDGREQATTSSSSKRDSAAAGGCRKSKSSDDPRFDDLKEEAEGQPERRGKKRADESSANGSTDDRRTSRKLAEESSDSKRPRSAKVVVKIQPPKFEGDAKQQQEQLYEWISILETKIASISQAKDEEIAMLQGQNESLLSEQQIYIKQEKQCQIHTADNERKNNLLTHQLAEANKRITFLERVELSGKAKDMRNLAVSHEQLDAENKFLRQQAASWAAEREEKEKMISELNSDLTKAGNERLGATRDDAYYVASLERVFDACTQLAKNMSRGLTFTDETIGKFTLDFQNECCNVVGQGVDWAGLLKQQSSRMVSAILVAVVVRHLMTAHRLLSFLGRGVLIMILSFDPKNELKLDDEMIKLRILAIRRLLKFKNVQECLTNHKDTFAKLVIDNLANCVTPSSPKRLELWNKKLREIFDDATNIFLEILQEPAQFEFYKVDPTQGWNGDEMVAVNGDIFEDGGKKVAIEFGMSPVVAKSKHNVKQAPAVLLKANVVLREEKPAGATAPTPQDTEMKDAPGTVDEEVDGVVV